MSVICLKNVRCNARADCSHGEDKYWCDTSPGSGVSRFCLPLMVPRQLSTETFDDKAAFACNRVIALRQQNTFISLCPPTFYGINCEFYYSIP
jgi:hypothetical protein